MRQKKRSRQMKFPSNSAFGNNLNFCHLEASSRIHNADVSKCLVAFSDGRQRDTKFRSQFNSAKKIPLFGKVSRRGQKEGEKAQAGLKNFFLQQISRAVHLTGKSWGKVESGTSNAFRSCSVHFSGSKRFLAGAKKPVSGF